MAIGTLIWGRETKMMSEGEEKAKTYLELLAERELIDRELMQARAREAESVLKEIVQQMWMFEFTPREIERAYRKHELTHGSPKGLRIGVDAKGRRIDGCMDLDGNGNDPHHLFGSANENKSEGT